MLARLVRNLATGFAVPSVWRWAAGNVVIKPTLVAGCPGIASARSASSGGQERIRYLALRQRRCGVAGVAADCRLGDGVNPRTRRAILQGAGKLVAHRVEGKAHGVHVRAVVEVQVCGKSSVHVHRVYPSLVLA
jgi:hypothetical protein